MIHRRLALATALPLLLFGRAASRPAAAAAPEKNCGDPNGRFIACSSISLPAPPPGSARAMGRCPLCGGLHIPLGD
ncbi:MAG TPA: hypothetical protein VGM87_14040 [Roseomonas sp.]|jgi:hypothetical protein